MPLLLVALLGKVAGARHTVAALRTAQISIGVVLLAATLGLIDIFFKPPGGIFFRLSGRALALVYYGILGVVAVFGFAEASFGYWAVPHDMDGDWGATVGEVVLWISLIFLALVAALGGLSFVN